MSSESRIASYHPLGLRLDQRFYKKADIDRVTEAAGVPLPSGLVAVEVLNPKNTTQWITRHVKRRAALVQKLEIAAHNYIVSAEFEKKPADSDLRASFYAIEHAATRLWKALGLEGKTNLDDIPHELKMGLRSQAELYGKIIGGYSDMSPLRWAMDGGEYVDYLGSAKLKQAVNSVELLRLWANGAAARANVRVERRAGQRVRNRGDEALNELFGNLAGVWLDVYERLPTTSVGAPGRANEGKGGGPFVRFIQAALRPVLGNGTPEQDAIRSRVSRLFHRRSNRGPKNSNLTISTVKPS